MRRIVLFVSIVLVFCINVWANEDTQVIDAEYTILKAGTIQEKYNKNIKINNDLLDTAASRAITEADKYTFLSRKPKVKIKLELKDCPKKFNLKIDRDISNYSGFIDEIIIDTGGINCYLEPQKFESNNYKEEAVDLTINDTDNIISKYNGTETIKPIKLLLITVFTIVALFLVFFMLTYVRKNDFKKGFNKKSIYVVGSMVACLCIAMVLVILFVDFEITAVRKKIKTNSEHLFKIECGSNETFIDGVSVGIPLYDEKFDTQYIAACFTNSDTAEGYSVIGGNYSANEDLIKFHVKNSGEYYIRNNKVTFNDIKESEKGLEEAVSVLSSKNIISGKADGMYGSEDNITRAEIVTILCKMLDLNMENTSGKGFDDISSSDWYYKYVMTGKENNLLSGFEDNTFRPSDNITREQMAVIAGQLMENMGYEVSYDVSEVYRFADVDDIRGYAKGYISLLVRENINIWENYYEPDRPLTRGEAAIILYRLYLLM